MADVPLMNNPMTAAEDLIVGGVSGAPTALPKGSDGDVLTVTAGAVDWAAPAGGTSFSAIRVERISSTFSITNGADTVVLYNSIIREDDAAARFSYATGTGLLTIATAGWYCIQGGVRWSSSSTGERIVYIEAGGGPVASSRQDASNNSDNTVGTTIYLAAAATVALRVVGTTTGLSIANDPRSFLSVHSVAA